MAAPTAITQTTFQTTARTRLRTNATDFTTAEIDAAVDEANQIVLAKIKECDYNYFSEYVTQYYLAYQQEYTIATTTEKLIYVEDFHGNEVKPVRLDSSASGYYFNGSKLGVKPIPTLTYTTWSEGTPTYATAQTFTLTGDYTRYFKDTAKIKYYPADTSTSKTETTLSTDSTFSTTTGLTTVTLTASDLTSTFYGLELQDGLLLTILPRFGTLAGTTDVPDFDSTWHFIIYDYIYYAYYLKFPTEGSSSLFLQSFFEKIETLVLPHIERDDAVRKIPIKVNTSGVNASTR